MGAVDRNEGEPLAWEEFAARLAEILELDSAAVGRDTRLIEDLGVDSVGLAELATFLMLDCGMVSLADDLDRREWDGVTAGQVYREYASSG